MVEMGKRSQISNGALGTKLEMKTVVVLYIFYLLDTCTCLFVHGNHFFSFSSFFPLLYIQAIGS